MRAKAVLIALGGFVVLLLIWMVFLLIWFVSLNNRLVALRENVRTAWGQVETVLQRRFDLIPNLVNTVKGYASHEKELFEQVTQLRSQWGSAQTTDEKVKTAGQLEGALARLLVVAERYPDLKASQNFRDLQYELAGTENRITVERQRYNDAVRAHNTAIRQFPGSVIAGMRGFTADAEYFEAAAGAKEAPKVDFEAK
jgi:LemA protein